MKETTFRELKEGQVFYLDKEGRLSEWKKIKPTSIPNTNGVYEKNAESGKTSLFVAGAEIVWLSEQC